MSTQRVAAARRLTHACWARGQLHSGQRPDAHICPARPGAVPRCNRVVGRTKLRMRRVRRSRSTHGETLGWWSEVSAPVALAVATSNTSRGPVAGRVCGRGLSYGTSAADTDRLHSGDVRRKGAKLSQSGWACGRPNCNRANCKPGGLVMCRLVLPPSHITRAGVACKVTYLVRWRWASGAALGPMPHEAHL